MAPISNLRSVLYFFKRNFVILACGWAINYGLLVARLLQNSMSPVLNYSVAIYIWVAYVSPMAGPGLKKGLLLEPRLS